MNEHSVALEHAISAMFRNSLCDDVQCDIRLYAH